MRRCSRDGWSVGCAWVLYVFFFSSRRRHTRCSRDWSSDVCSSDWHSPKANPPRAIHAMISGAKNRMVLPEELGASADGPLERVAAEIYAGLGPALRQANTMDFDDLLLFPLTLFAEHPERLAHWQRRFDHALVDEFQD